MIFEIPQYKITANEATPVNFLVLPSGVSRVSVVYKSGTTGTLVPKFTTAPENTGSYETVQENGTNISLTGSGYFLVTGPGYLCWTVASLSVSGEIDVHATR